MSVDAEKAEMAKMIEWAQEIITDVITAVKMSNIDDTIPECKKFMMDSFELLAKLKE